MAPAAGAPLPDTISRLLARPDLRIAPHERSLAFVADLPTPFQVDAGGRVQIGPACLARGEGGACLLRHALELAWLLPRLAADPVLAGLAAGRTAAVFAAIRNQAHEPWQVALAQPTPPDIPAMMALWQHLARLQPATDTPGPVIAARLAAIWPLLGPTEALLQSGGDQRLRVDPATGLNHYGCSHRPRPWAVTFASSTASSSSERGFAAAEACRQRITIAALSGQADAALAAEAGGIRAHIAVGYALPVGTAIILAASGTDCELIAAALCASGPTTNLLIAPEETGSGVPLAACLRHFAPDTARGATVVKGKPIDGAVSPALATVAARAADGSLRPAAAIEADCDAAIVHATSKNRRTLLHLLDLSKTGYLAPDVAAVARLAAKHGPAVQVVVDACQARLTAERVRDYLGRRWMVLITGSKFLTGPPFAGAVLLPPGFALDTRMPAGLADYSSRAEWPDCAAASGLPARANYGLLLRWRAALAEFDALAAVPADRQSAILIRFCTRLRQAIAASPDVQLLEVPPPHRPDAAWDSQQTIIGFMTRPDDPLDPDEARRLYHWLNADLRPALPATLSAEQERLAALRCHIGQPVPLPGAHGRMLGILRISAGARLISGEPSHHDLDEAARLLREIGDALAVLAKISLILQYWDRLAAADPLPSF